MLTSEGEIPGNDLVLADVGRPPSLRPPLSSLDGCSADEMQQLASRSTQSDFRTAGHCAAALSYSSVIDLLLFA